jgi:hypothetical protein
MGNSTNDLNDHTLMYNPFPMITFDHIAPAAPESLNRKTAVTLLARVSGLGVPAPATNRIVNVK